MKLNSKHFIFYLLIAVANIAQAQIVYSPNQEFRVYSSEPTVNMDLSFEATAPSGSITSVYAIINGTNHQANHVSGNQYSLVWGSSSFGNFPIKGFMTTTNGETDSTFLTNFKIIELTQCPLPEWDSSISYVGGYYVFYQGFVYTANYWTLGEEPGNSSAWNLEGICSSQNYPTLNCTYLPSWDSAIIYGPNNYDIDIEYNGIVYHAAYWSQNNQPDLGAPWNFVAVCATLNELPLVYSTFVDSVIIQTTLSNHEISANITDADGDISNVEFVIDGNNIYPINVNQDNYSVNWTPTSYGIFPIQIIATDDELAVKNLSGTIQIASSLPPIISSVYPTSNLNIKNIYNLNSDTIRLQTDAFDPDGTIDEVIFSVNGQEFLATNLNGDSFFYDWIPSEYGSHELIVKATDNSGTYSLHQLQFEIMDPYFESIDIENMPLQIQANLGYDKVFDFGENISEVIVRNTDLINISYSGNQLTINSNRPGRTGLKITSSSGVYYLGIRINNCDGSIPGMPDYASIGYKSQDITPDLEFWEDMDFDMTNKNMDVRYIYINGGPAVSGNYNSWRDSTRTIKYCVNSLKYGLIPFFVYYNIPDGGESFFTNLEHVQDTAYMTEYFQDLNNFITHSTSILGDELFGIVLEPDFLGYLQQLGVIHLGTNNPDEISTCVNDTIIAPDAGTIHTLVDRINKTINDRRDAGANLYYGWQLNLWSAGLNGPLGLMRRTDANDLGWEQGRATIIEAATSTVNYGMASGILSSSADFVSIDKYGLDAEGYSDGGVTANPWWFNHDHWDNYMNYAKTMHQVAGVDMVLWQLPVGRINGSHYVSAYTNQTYPDLPNTANKYEDSTVDYFFGDVFTEIDSTRFDHFTQNNAQDTTLNVSGNTISWDQHISKFGECGIVNAMFGAGVGWSTDGIGNPPADEYFSIQKIQDYYKDHLSFLPDAPFTDSILTYPSYSTYENLAAIYPNATNFVGKGCSSQGILNPSELGVGTHFVTFIVPSGNCKEYKVQKIIVTSNCFNNYYVSAEICQGSSYLFGDQELISSGNYTQTFIGSDGCDSIVSLDLNVIIVDVSVNVAGSVLTANAEDANYQWLDCNNNYSPIAGETSKVFEVNISGDYAVEITHNECIDTSACYNIVISSIFNDDFASSIKIYPSPTSGKVKINMGIEYKNTDIVVFNMLGEKIMETKFGKGRLFEIEIIGNPGIYFMQISTPGDKIAIKKIVKE